MESTDQADSAAPVRPRNWRAAEFFFHKAWIALLLLALLTAGCITLDDPEAAQDLTSEIVTNIQPEQTFEQTIQVRRPGLSQITLYLGSSAVENDSIWLNVNVFDQAADDTSALASLRLPLAASTGSVPLNIKIPEQQHSSGRTYRLQVSVEAGEGRIYGRLGDQYPYGQAYLSGEPLDADAAFRTAYLYDLSSLARDLAAALPHLWLALPLAAILLLPGWAVLVLLGLNRRFALPEALALSLGLSLALFPVLMSWSSAAGIAWSRFLLVAALSLLALAAAIRVLKPGGAISLPPDTSITGVPAHWATLLLAAILSGTLVVRFLMIRNLSAPPWVDSVHHGLITRLIMEGGGYPQSYAPFLSIAPTAYHPGFHSVLAAFLWLSGMDISRGMLYLGQVLNALAVVAVYLLAVTLTKDRAAGLTAALIAGFFTPMPAYYTSWGRYPHLAGLIILVTAFVLIAASMDSFKETTSSKRLRAALAASAGLAGAGLFITHYRVAVFLAALLAAHWLVWLFSQSKLQLRPFRLDISQTRRLALPAALAIGWAALVGIALAVPWLPAAIGELLLPKLDAWRGSPVPAFSDFTWSYLTSARGMWAMRIAAVGLVLGLLKRQPASLSLPLWIGLMLLLANLDSLGLPGGGLINDSSVTITLFMPIAVAAGMLVGDANAVLIAFIPGKLKPAYAVLVAVSGAVISILAAKSLIPLLNPTTFLYRQEDENAIRWVAENTLPGETILINPFAWGYGTYAGQDGAYWISALAGRPTIPPPVLYGLGNSSTEITGLNQQIQHFIDQASNPEALRELMQAQGIRYLVTGRRGGIFSPRLLLESQVFQMRYKFNGVWVLEAIYP